MHANLPEAPAICWALVTHVATAFAPAILARLTGSGLVAKLVLNAAETVAMCVVGNILARIVQIVVQGQGLAPFCKTLDARRTVNVEHA